MRSNSLALIALVFLFVGCDESNDEVVIEQAPLGVDVTVPADLPSPYSGDQEPLSVTFNRATGVDEMQVSLFPNTNTGAFTPNSQESRRTWTWWNVEFDPTDGCYFWLIDGVTMGRFVNLLDDRVFLRTPLIVRIPSSPDRKPAVGFQGQVSSLSANVIASGTIVFALPVDSGFNPLDPGATFDPTDAVGIALATRSDDFLEEDAPYRATMLPIDTEFIVVAVSDTNNDLNYSPYDDWWGTYEVDGESVSAWAREDTGEKDSRYNFGVSINLRAPTPLPE
jgi:hypothetical protein